MGCGTGIMRTILIFFNTIFLLAGLAGIGGGIWMAVSPGSLFEFIKVAVEDSDTIVRNAAYIFIAASVFVVLVAGLGCFGACARNRCALGTYSAFMIILLILQIAAIVLIIVFDQRFANDQDSINKVTEAFKKAYNNPDAASFKKVVDDVQNDFKCCGINGPTDYTVGTMPTSCAGHPEGCYQAIRDWVKSNLGLVIGITVAIIVFQLILFIFGICLCRNSDFEKIA